MPEVRGRQGQKNWSSGSRPHHRKKGQEEQFPSKERRRMTQLLICLLLFGVLLIGRAMPGGQVSAVIDKVNGLIHENTDFRETFSRVGKSVSEGEPFHETFGTFFSSVFGGGEEEIDAGTGEMEGRENEEDDGMVETEESEAEPEEAPEAETAEPVQVEPTAGVTMQKEELVTPVNGIITSSFGYRSHPIDGEWKHHDGVDIIAEEGTPILAFASGKVDYIGESPSYGLYLQLKHDNGMTSFYAHCSEIHVRKGARVSGGESIGKVGSTGNVTGPHLHFELKKDGVRVDPTVYIHTEA